MTDRYISMRTKIYHPLPSPAIPSLGILAGDQNQRVLRARERASNQMADMHASCLFVVEQGVGAPADKPKESSLTGSDQGSAAAPPSASPKVTEKTQKDKRKTQTEHQESRTRTAHRSHTRIVCGHRRAAWRVQAPRET